MLKKLPNKHNKSYMEGLNSKNKNIEGGGFPLDGKMFND